MGIVEFNSMGVKNYSISECGKWHDLRMTIAVGRPPIVVTSLDHD